MKNIFFGPRELRAGWRLAIFIAIMVSVTAAVNLLIRRLLPHAPDEVLFLVREVEDIIIVTCVTWLMGRMEHRTLADYGLPWRRAFRSRFWQGTLLGFVAASALMIALRLTGNYSFGTIALHGGAILMWAAIWAVIFVLVGLKEEFRARGYGLFTLARGIGFWPAAIVWAAYFAYTHHSNQGETWIGLLNVGLFGLLASLLLRKTGNLWLPIGFHMAFDWSETYVYGVADSGHVLPGHLLSSSPTGASWLSGGTVGPEGSVLCSLLIVVLFLMFAMWKPKHDAGLLTAHSC